MILTHPRLLISHFLVIIMSSQPLCHQIEYLFIIAPLVLHVPNLIGETVVSACVEVNKIRHLKRCVVRFLGETLLGFLAVINVSHHSQEKLAEIHSLHMLPEIHPPHSSAAEWAPMHTRCLTKQSEVVFFPHGTCF